MKNLIKTILLMVFPFVVIAQSPVPKDFDIEISRPYKVIDSYSRQYFNIGDNIFAFKHTKDGYVIQKFSTSTLKLVSTKNITGLPDKIVVESIREIDDKLFFFYSLWDKKNEKEQLFYQEVNLATGNLDGKEKLLISVDGKVTGTIAGTGKLYGVQIVDKFKFYNSNDDSLLLIRYRKKPSKRNDAKSNDVIGFNVFTSNLTKVWTKEVRMPYTEKKMDNIDYHIDHKANVYLLSMIYNGSASSMELVKGKPNYRIEVIKISPDSDEVKRFQTSLGSKMINSISLYQGYENDLIMGGYYTISNKDIHDARGIFYLRMDENGIVKDKSTFEFPLAVLNQNESNKTIRKNDKKSGEKAEFSNLRMMKIIVEDDGSVVLVGEQAYVVTTTGKTTSVTHYFNDIIVAKIDSDGELAWLKKLPKKQRGRNTGKKDMSFRHFGYNGKHYFLYMDNAKNLNLDLKEEPVAHAAGLGGYLTQYELDSRTGELSKTHILNAREVKKMVIYQFAPERITNISDGVYVIEVYKKNKQDILIKATHKL